jgi:phosphohistidine phosphatase
MRLFFLRHAVAYSREEWQGAEADRPLTDDGQREMALVAGGLRALDLRIDLLLTSPFARALQTAEIAAKQIQKQPVQANELAPGATLAGLTRLLAAHADARRVMVVGHEPDFSQIIGELIAGSHPASLVLKKAGCARVDVSRHALQTAADGHPLAGHGELIWLLTARQLTRIGGHAPLQPDTREYEEQHT